MTSFFKEWCMILSSVSAYMYKSFTHVFNRTLNVNGIIFPIKRNTALDFYKQILFSVHLQWNSIISMPSGGAVTHA